MNNLIGVIGGLGPKATTYFMDLVINNTISECDQDNVDLLVCQFSSIPDRTSFILGNSDNSPVPEMIKSARILEREGCKYIVIPCNTASYFFDEVQSRVNSKIINILEETSKFVLKDKPKKVGLMATDGTIKSGAYHKFIGNDLLFVPDDVHQEKVMNIIYNKVKKNKEVSLDEFEEILDYFRENGCEKIILGCTELSVIYSYLKVSYSDVVDSLTVLARKAVELSGKSLKE